MKKNVKYNTSLHNAAGHGDIRTVELYIENGSNINLFDIDGWTPVYCATLNGHLEIVKLLIEYGSNINLKDKVGWTPLHVAAEKGHIERNEWTPLHVAADNGDIEIIKLLIENGSDINIKNNKGKTAEDVARNEKIRVLIKTTKLQKTLLERQEKLTKESNRIFSIITRYTKLIDIIYLISLQRR